MHVGRAAAAIYRLLLADVAHSISRVSIGFTRQIGCVHFSIMGLSMGKLNSAERTEKDALFKIAEVRHPSRCTLISPRRIGSSSLMLKSCNLLDTRESFPQTIIFRSENINHQVTLFPAFIA